MLISLRKILGLQTLDNQQPSEFAGKIFTKLVLVDGLRFHHSKLLGKLSSEISVKDELSFGPGKMVTPLRSESKRSRAKPILGPWPKYHS